MDIAREICTDSFYTVGQVVTAVIHINSFLVGWCCGDAILQLVVIWEWIILDDGEGQFLE